MIPFKRLVAPPENVEVIAKRFGIRELHRLRERFGGEKWRKMKGFAHVELISGEIRYAELHWYECHAIGKRKIKVKQLID